MMSGEKQLTVDERLAQFEKIVDDYIYGKNLQAVPFNPEFEQAVSMNDDELRQLSSEEALNRSYMAFSYANHMQEEYNKHVVRHNYACDNIRRIVTGELERFDKYTKHETKQQYIVNENTVANRLDIIRQHSKARMDRLENRIRDIRRIGEVLLELSKRKHYS